MGARVARQRRVRLLGPPETRGVLAFRFLFIFVPSFIPNRLRRSRRVIWFREGSPNHSRRSEVINFTKQSPVFDRYQQYFPQYRALYGTIFS